MLLPVAALEFITKSDAFKQKVKIADLKPDYCLEIRIKLLPNPIDEYYYYQVYFDYGLPGNSKKDIICKLRIFSDGSFQILQLDLKDN